MRNFSILIIIFSSFILQSCKNYYFLQHTPKQSKDSRYFYNLKFSNENIEFYTYGDYVYNKVDKKLIYFKTKDIDKVLKLTINKPFTEQFLFMYTYMSTYNNLLGFYYENTSIEEVKKFNYDKESKDLGNGVLYTYNFGKFNIVDIYRKTNIGVIRFININNPNEKDIDHKKFHREVRGLFFDLNSELWENSYVDFK